MPNHQAGGDTVPRLLLCRGERSWIVKATLTLSMFRAGCGNHPRKGTCEELAVGGWLTDTGPHSHTCRSAPSADVLQATANLQRLLFPSDARNFLVCGQQGCKACSSANWDSAEPRVLVRVLKEPGMPNTTRFFFEGDTTAGAVRERRKRRAQYFSSKGMRRPKPRVPAGLLERRTRRPEPRIPCRP